MPTLDANNNLRRTSFADATRRDTASVQHDVEAGAVLETGSSGASSVTADITDAAGSATVDCADPESVLARLRAGHTVSQASDTKAFTVAVQATLDAAVEVKAHAEVFAQIDGGELENQGSSRITSPCDDEGGADGDGDLDGDAPLPTDEPWVPLARAAQGG